MIYDISIYIYIYIYHHTACYPALHVLSSQLSLSVTRVHLAEKTAGVWSLKLPRIASLNKASYKT